MNENSGPTHDRHRQTRELLPWYVNGTLDEGDTGRVEAHLAQCPQCREELAFDQKLKAELPEPPVGLDAETGWAALRDRLNAPSAADDKVIGFRPRSFLRRTVPLGWALAAQAAAIVLMVGVGQLAVTKPVAEPEYHALASESATGGGNMLVMFRPDLRETDLRGILLANRAELAGGPNVSGAYLLRVDPRAIEATLSRLRRDPQVTLAQPIGEEGP